MSRTGGVGTVAGSTIVKAAPDGHTSCKPRMQPNEFDAFLAADTQVTGRIVKAANIKSN